MPSTAIMRLICLLLALGVSWALFGSIFVSLANGSHLLSAWMIGGTIIFLAGWIVVGLPLVALGDRISSLKYVPVITIAPGLAGGLILFVPDLLIRAMDRNHQYPWSLSELAWPAIAFSIAALTALTYCILLRTSIVGKR